MAWAGLALLDLDWTWVAVLGQVGPELAGAWLGLGWAYSIGGLSRNISGSMRKQRNGWLGLPGFASLGSNSVWKSQDDPNTIVAFST